MDRPLDGFELVYYAASSVARINGNGIARVRGPLQPALLRPALDALQRRHPMLGVRIVERQGVPHWTSIGTPPIPLDVEPRRGPDHWKDAVDRLLNDRFDLARGPLLRCVVLHGQDGVHDIILAFHHIIGDGMSTISAFDDLLRAHARLAAGQDPGLEPLPEVPPLRDLSPMPVRGLRGRLVVLREVLHLLNLFRKAKPQVLRWDARVPREQRHSRLISHVVPLAEAEAIAARSRKEGTTITGALTAALLWALAEDVGGPSPTVMCSIPANLRPHLKAIPPPAFGYYAWGFGTIQNFAPAQRFWDVARAVRQDVDRELARGGLWRSLAILEWQGPRTLKQGPEKLLRSLDQSGANSVSNVGRVQLAQHGNLVWEDLQFWGSADGAGAGIGLVATTIGDHMTLNFVHPEPLVAAARGDRIAARTLALLREAIAGDPVVPVGGPAGSGTQGS